jgi:glycine dehydrogenase
MTQTLSQLENRGAFIERHIGPDAQQQQEMLKTVGADSLNALIGQIVPQDIQLATPRRWATRLPNSPRWRS